jgi:hypothetical protein
MWHRWRKAQRDAITLTPNPAGGIVKHFRLDPYVTATPQEFCREDDAHNDVLRWISETSRPVLFLSGVSGAGKSSVLEAYVLPMLREAGWTIEHVRVEFGSKSNGKARSRHHSQDSAMVKADRRHSGPFIEIRARS